MNETITKKDLIEALSGLATKQDLEEGFALSKKETDQKFSQLTTIMMDNFDRIDSNIEELKEDVKIIGSHDRRIEALENHDRILKGVLENDLHAKVAW